MRPREPRDEAPPPEPSPVPPARGGLSSMVVRPSESDGGVDVEAEDAGGANGRRDSPTATRRRSSSRDLHRRDASSGFRRRESPLTAHRRGSPPDFCGRGGSPGFLPRYQRFHDGSGYSMRAGSISPRHRQRLDYDPYIGSSDGQRFGRGFRGTGEGERFRDVSPHYRHGRGGRSSGRGYKASGRGLPPFEGEYVHRNDPNLSPREGDWICRNPSCGNLNFARRTHCNNCNMFRYGPELHGPGRSPRRGYIHSPSRGSSVRNSGPPVGRSLPRDMDRYRSPPRGWDVEDPRDFGEGSPPGRGGRYVDYMQRGRPGYRDELDIRARGKVGLPLPEWDGREGVRDGFFSDRRGYVRRTPSPQRRWIVRERSPSPLGERSLKGSYLGHGREDRHYNSYLDGQGEDATAGHGRGYRPLDTYTSRGRGDRRGIARGRSDNIY